MKGSGNFLERKTLQNKSVNGLRVREERDIFRSLTFIVSYCYLVIKNGLSSYLRNFKFLVETSSLGLLSPVELICQN